MPLSLSDVTICAADSVCVPLSARALTRSMSLCTFGDAILFTDTAISGPFRTVAIPKLASKDDYNHFVLRTLRHHIQTPYVLIVQWDGYVLSAAAWRDEFKTYDYIGARWPWYIDGMTVGNGGFSWRSKKLLEAMAAPDIQITPEIPEDALIGRTNRRLLEAKYGIQFAPDAVADQFAFERTDPIGPTFGFHGLFTLWQHASDSDLTAMIEHLPPATLRGREYVELMLGCYQTKREAAFVTLYNKRRSEAQAPDLQTELFALTRDTVIAAQCLQAGEQGAIR